MRAGLMAAGALLMLVACDDEINLPEPAETSGLTPDYCGVQELMDAKCLTCHGANASYPELTDIADVVDVASDSYPEETFVVPGDADASFLYAKCAGEQGDAGAAMPLGSDGLDADELDVLAQWIDDGATTDCEAR
ncbi:MAG: c-type cytochrome [Myxococcota bacterium]|nr:c-type cytochrome [Myxococcota bacterium]